MSEKIKRKENGPFDTFSLKVVFIHQELNQQSQDP